jgi:3-methyladenine DNA glycosylase AlkD
MRSVAGPALRAGCAGPGAVLRRGSRRSGSGASIALRSLPWQKQPVMKRAAKKPAAKAAASAHDAASVIAWLEGHASKRVRDGMARFAIPSDNALGVSVGVMRAFAKRLGKDHQLALALWKTGGYEARMMAIFVDEPPLVTPAQMDRWCRDFDSWAICDTACFHLFDRTPHALTKVRAWSEHEGEFQKRAAFALLASLALHDKGSPDAPYLRCLPLIERAAVDHRNFVKKSVGWALRAIGKRSPELRAAALQVAQRLAASGQPGARWVSNDAIRGLLPRRR